MAPISSTFISLGYPQQLAPVMIQQQQIGIQQTQMLVLARAFPAPNQRTIFPNIPLTLASFCPENKHHCG
jgi:hypothetical protein